MDHWLSEDFCRILKYHKVIFDGNDILGAYIETEEHRNDNKIFVGRYVILTKEYVIILHYVRETQFIKITKINRKNIISVDKELFLDYRTDDWNQKTPMNEYKKATITTLNSELYDFLIPELDKEHHFNYDFIEKNVSRYNHLIDKL